MKASVAVAASTLAVANGTYWNSTAGFAAPTIGYAAATSGHEDPSNGASAACTPTTSTIYVPFTETYTVYSTSTVLPSSVEAAGLSGSSLAANSYTTVSTITTVITHTNTVTEVPTVTLTSASSSSTPYLFYVTDGSTVWLGSSPTGSVAVSTTAITIVPVRSTPEPDTTTTVHSTSYVLTTTTITPPEYTSTTFSYTSPDLTTTLTSTSYRTISLSRVTSHSSFTGVNSAGWNVTGTQPIVLPTPELSTMTMVVLQGTGNATTTTITTQITATIGDVITRTFPAPAQTGTLGSSGTEEPVVMTMTVGGGIVTSTYSTSIVASLSTGVLSNAPVSAETVSTPLPLPLSGPTTVDLTTMLASAPTSGTSDSSPNPSAYGLPSGNSISNTSVPATAPSDISSVSYFTVTSFFSGSGTTFVLTSMPTLNTPRISNVNGTMFTVSASGAPSSRATTISTLLSGSSSESTVPIDTTASDDQSLSAAEATGSSVIASSDRATTTGSNVPAISSTTVNSERDSSTRTSATDATTPRTSGSSTELSSSFGSSLGASTESPKSSITSERTRRTSAETPSSSRSMSSHHTIIVSTTSESLSTRSRNITSPVTTRPTRASTFSNPFPPTSNTAIPTQGCGEQGDFTMDFDNLPTFNGGRAKLFHRQEWNTTAGNSTSSGGNGTSDITQQPPLSMRPYRHMLFSNGYVYAPKPVEPFAPASSPNVAVFLADGTGFRSGPHPNGLEPGEMGDGPFHEGDPAFFFDAKGAALGCDNSGPGPCTLEVTSMVWDNRTKDDVPSNAQNYTLPPCEGFQNCQLTKVDFPSSFNKLSGLRMRAVHNQEPRMFFVDDMKMRWADSSCDAGMRRQRSR